ncbi:VWA domain-containing protein [Arthrobacter sp. GMC3]|uniref:vWA domain-containing protein n=1 Tax=Arthrobacter sp. GMC3 TaxID=2058894 RepID=UPI00215758EA|nr:VWA domain-containing protein [Arthrobacter sp. GMC3]
MAAAAGALGETTDPDHSAEEILLAFAGAVRAAGVKVTADRSRSFVEAVAQLSGSRTALERLDVFWAGRATLCSAPDELVPYQRTFEAWFSPTHSTAARQETTQTTVSQASWDDDAGTSDGAADPVSAIASRRELLRHRDIASLDSAERALLNRMFEELVVRLPHRPSRRKQLNPHGGVDRVRTLRDQLRRGGEPGPLRRSRVPRKPRRMVWLIDVSGSMAPYADSLLRLAHRVVQQEPHQVEVFTLGTRLTRVTTALLNPDPELALIQAGRTVPDWSGGTRLGEVLGAFNDHWGQRSVARGAVVVIASDGWERGDPALLGQQVQRLHHLARRIIWSNPHRGKAGYAPVQQGIKAVLPHVDYFMGGHSMKSFEELLAVVGNA